METVLLTTVEAARALGVGRTKVYELIKTRRLRSVKIGACRRVPVDAVREYVDSLTGEGAAA